MTFYPSLLSETEKQWEDVVGLIKYHYALYPHFFS